MPNKTPYRSPRVEIPASVEQPRLRLKLAPSQPNPYSKLTDVLQAKICGLIANGARLRVTRQTCHNWRVRGVHDPNGRYGRFLAAVNTTAIEFCQQLGDDSPHSWSVVDPRGIRCTTICSAATSNTPLHCVNCRN
jgi:hypothetical protein